MGESLALKKEHDKCMSKFATTKKFGKVKTTLPVSKSTKYKSNNKRDNKSSNKTDRRSTYDITSAKQVSLTQFMP